MIWFLFGHLFATLISLVYASRLSENEKDLEIAILRHQSDVMVREQKQPVRANRVEKATLAILITRKTLNLLQL